MLLDWLMDFIACFALLPHVRSTPSCAGPWLGIVGIASTGSPTFLIVSSSVRNTFVPSAVTLSLISFVSHADFSAYSGLLDWWVVYRVGLML
jgi:hypothetical protein